jgi:transcriptional regulator with XRE-family HTH domain
METFSCWLEHQIRQRSWKPADLARAAGIPNATISRILNGTRQAGPDVCRAIAKALRVSQEEVFRQRGFLDPIPSPVAAEEELVYLYRSLNPDRREIALDVMRGLVQGMSGHYAFVPADENALDAACFRAIMNLADEEKWIETIRKIQGNTTLRQQLGIDRKLDRMDAEDEARCGTGPDESGGSKTS